ncbi:MAG: excinuclease ABC subunit UvrC [Rhodospirillaceae bacterium]|jgi:excinuclease ABC subunit C|nr:excinuclease ABC subunit UvrC [Rhodospirillaceae bacterium]MBT5811138.1 excinuclease ABC subunit UvrC [Rhodospirillaceae bacterium]
MRKTALEDGGVQSVLGRGVKVIRDCLKTLPGAPGVYRMLNGRGDVLYVGKAGRLNRRVAAYTIPSKLPIRLQRMVAETESMEIVTTHTEVEALLLESNLIKKMRPRYNVLLRDDKTFPHILITSDQDYPQVIKHRGAQKRPGHYFGPFASAGAVNRTLSALQRAFLLRNCTDSVFNNRRRPCLQYHIKRCSAPCVNRISLRDYQGLVDEAREFLADGSRAIQDKLVEQMQHESDNLKFEAAARIRDRIHALTQVQAHQDINLESVEDADVIALHQDRGQSCVQVFFFRGGRNYGNRAYFPSHDRHHEPADVLAAFIGQFYDDKPPPRTILLSHDIPERDLITEALSQRADHKVQVTTPKRGVKLKPVEHALANARDALGRRQAESASQRRLLDALAARLDMETPPTRIEIYDNSHIQGTNAVGAMVVSGPDGFVKAAYRKFNIKSIGQPTDENSPPDTRPDTPPDAPPDATKESPRGGDDYAMMREVLTRRFMRALKEDPDRTAETWPELILIDGGPGQTAIAHDVLSELGIDDIAVLGVAKGPDRDAGREHLYRPGRAAFTLPMRDPLLYFIQRLRDEAHRFAISTHRARRSKAIAASPLDEIAGIGAKRKKALLLHFGSARGVSGAGLSDLAAVEGISTTVAEKIYGHFHTDH